MKKKKSEPLTGCALCGAPIALESGFKRCTEPTCRHVQGESVAFAPCVPREPAPHFIPYERQRAKPVDEEFQ